MFIGSVGAVSHVDQFNHYFTFCIQTLEFLEQKQRSIRWAVIIVILLGSTIYALYLGNQLRYPDEKEYVAIAKNLADKGIYSLDGIRPTAFRPPGFVIPLSLLHFLGGNIFSYRMFNNIALVFAIWFITEEISSRLSGLDGSLSALMFLAYPVLIYTSGTLYPQTLQLSLMSILLLLGTRSKITKSNLAVLGFLVAWTFLTTPTTLFMILVVGIYWLLNGIKTKHILIVVSISALIVGGWSVRSSLAMGQLVLVSTNFGINFLLGNSSNTNPDAGTNVDISSYTEMTTGLNEVERDRYYQEAAISYIREHPTDATKLYFLKVLNYFNYRNDLATKTESSTLNDFIMFITYYPLLLLALTRLVCYKKFPLTSFEIIAAVTYFASAFVDAIVFNRVRFRLPYDVFLILLVLQRKVRHKNGQSAQC